MAKLAAQLAERLGWTPRTVFEELTFPQLICLMIGLRKIHEEELEDFEGFEAIETESAEAVDGISFMTSVLGDRLQVRSDAG
mgnify:CR=1 FL=1